MEYGRRHPLLGRSLFRKLIHYVGFDRATRWSWDLFSADELYELSGSLEEWALKILNLHRNEPDHITFTNLSADRTLLKRFFAEDVGKSYSIGSETKKRFILQLADILRNIPTATRWQHHVVLVTEILSIPRDVPGNIVECGCYKGGSSATLSLAAQLTGRKLLVCDSFEGLPEDDAGLVHNYPHLKVYGHYQKGMYAGPMEEVKENIRRYGSVEACEFIKGFFNETLANVKGPFAFLFLDVDLLSSMRDCVKALWPKLIENGLVFTDDSCDMEVVRFWFDDLWWNETFGVRSPGYIGSGCGLPLFPDFCSLGYTRKVEKGFENYFKVSWLCYPD